jgi:putative phosphoribosyl transferase
MLFNNRNQKARKATPSLSSYKDSNALVLGIPKGGLEIAFYLSATLNAELSFIISKKLSYPGHEEYGFGAICENDVVHIRGEKHLVTDDIIQKIIEREKKEIQKKIYTFRGGMALPEMKGRTVILTDDGTSSGITLIPVIKLCRQLNASKVIVAVPIAGKPLDPLLNEADEIILVQQPELFSNIKQAFKSFQTLSDSETFSFINKYTLYLS